MPPRSHAQIAIKAAVLPEVGAPLLVEEVLLDPPEATEVLVRIAAAGICHSDLHLAQGHLGYERVPIVLGHEGAGVVEAVGSEVRHVRRGDHVAFNFVPACGGCPSCRAGRPNLCETAAAFSWKGTMLDGTTRLHRADGGPLLHFNFVSCFAEACVVPAASAVLIPPGLPMAEAALLGCAVVTGVGAVRNAARVRIGDSVCVIGCGGVGLQVVAAARLAGAARIIAVDRGWEKLEAALARGATHAVDALAEDVVERVLLLSDGGVDHAFEIVGSPSTIRQAWDVLRPGGSAVVVGISPRGSEVVLPALDMLSQKGIKGSYYGSGNPAAEIPGLAEMVATGRFPLADSVTTVTSLEGIQEGFDRMLEGVGGRTVAVFGATPAKEELTA
jgi:S-(hydroxymethyl)glutathione dehydrogenase/alcohol dehydrogenase